MTNQGSFFPDRQEVGLTQTRSKSSGKLRTSRKTLGNWWDGPEEKTSNSEKIYDCSTCGLSKQCRSPKISRYGEGKKGILIVGMCPGKEEDEDGIPLIGKSGRLLKKQLSLLGIDLDRDCIRTNAVACFKSTDPSKEQIKACQVNLLRDITEVKPKLIICLGDIAINTVLEKPKSCKFPGSFYAGMLHGLVISSQKFNCWIGSSYHPSFYLHRENNPKVPYDPNLLLFDIASTLAYLDKPLPKHLLEEGNHLLDNVDAVIAQIQRITNIEKPVSYDYETTRLTPWEKNAKLVSIAFSESVDSGYFIPLNFINPNTFKPFFSSQEVIRITEAWQQFLISKTPKIVQNMNMEGSWDRIYLKSLTCNIIHDTMIGSHVLHCQKNTSSLGFQVFLMTGHDYKEMVNTKNIMATRLEDLFHYNCWDARYTLMAYYYQKSLLEKEGRLAEFNDFMLKGEEVLLGLQCRGVPINPVELTNLQNKYKKEQDDIVKEINKIIGVQKYKETTGNEFNPESTPQIAAVLRNHYKISPEIDDKLPKTATGLLCTDKDAIPVILERVQDREAKHFLEKILRFRKCGSIVERADNYWKNLDSNNRVHPVYLLLCDTYRSSSENPNIQNVFKHDEELQIFRTCIVPSPGRILLEVDLGGIEVCVNAMASGDEELIRQIIDGVDTHRKWASLIYQKSESEITKEERYEAKNGFVFASFYGAVPETISFRFPTVSKDHIAKVQEQFWKEFAQVKKYQIEKIENYKNLGYVEALTGFRRYGPLTINKIYNTPIQGVGFHILLNSLINLDNPWDGLLKSAGFRSEILFEVHDSLTWDAFPEEAFELVKFVTDIMTKKYYDWHRNVPLKVEWEYGGGNWFGLKELVFRDCSFCGKTNSPMGKKAKKLESGKKENHFECGFCGKEEIVSIN